MVNPEILAPGDTQWPTATEHPGCCYESQWLKKAPFLILSLVSGVASQEGPRPNSMITTTGKSKSGSPLQNLKTQPPTEQCRWRCPERQPCYEEVTWGGVGRTLWFACLLHLSPQFIYFCLLCASDLLFCRLGKAPCSP